MKRLMLLGLFAIAITSCQKLKKSDPFEKGDTDTPCAIVNSDAVTQAVKDAFSTKYSGITVTTWFNKDNNGYCALFIQNGKQTIAQFNNDGTFVKVQTDNDQEGDHKDKNQDNGCSCELEDGD